MNDERTRAILLIHCDDRPGLVAAVANYVLARNGNIVGLEQHVDSDRGVFFMRIEWSLANFGIGAELIAADFDRNVARLFGMHFSLAYVGPRPRVALFVSTMSHCLYDLLARWDGGEWAVDISLVVSNHEVLRPVADRFGLPFHHVPVDPADRAAAEAAHHALIESSGVELIVLARYMQILSADFVSRYPGRIINIHHSFLPAFKGARPYHAAHERGVKIIGATSHYVTADLDEGPIIAQDVAHVSHRDGVAELVQKGRDLEKLVLARAVRAHVERKVLIFGNRTIVFDG